MGDRRRPSPRITGREWFEILKEEKNEKKEYKKQIERQQQQLEQLQRIQEQQQQHIQWLTEENERVTMMEFFKKKIQFIEMKLLALELMAQNHLFSNPQIKGEAREAVRRKEEEIRELRQRVPNLNLHPAEEVDEAL